MADQAQTLRSLGGKLVALNGPVGRRLLSVTGGKGGVGKSTVALNLAVSYARRGGKTLAVDGDLGMADLNLLLGLAPGKSALDVLRGDAIADCVVEAHGIDLLPALNGNHQLANLDRAGRQILFAAIDELVAQYDNLIVDTPAGIGETAMTFAGAATDVVVVTTPEPLSLADAYACLKVLSTRHGLERAFVLPNVVRSPSEAEEVVARLRSLVDRFLGLRLIPLPAVPWDPTVAQAAAAGVPLVLHRPESPAARALGKAAQRIDALADADGTRSDEPLRLRRRGEG
jgi:flagellar biosynthesis protein FlhG